MLTFHHHAPIGSERELERIVIESMQRIIGQRNRSELRRMHLRHAWRHLKQALRP